MHFDDILMAEMLTAKAKAYKMNLPGFGEFKKSAEGVVADPRQNEHLKEKILAIQLRHIEDLIRISQQTAQTANSRTGDFSPRFFTATQRDFHRAVAWFFALTQLEKTRNDLLRSSSLAPAADYFQIDLRIAGQPDERKKKRTKKHFQWIEERNFTERTQQVSLNERPGHRISNFGRDTAHAAVLSTGGARPGAS